jgi:hypothetical protein
MRGRLSGVKFEEFAAMSYEQGMGFHHFDVDTGEPCKGTVYAVLQICDSTTYECEFHGLLGEDEVE